MGAVIQLYGRPHIHIFCWLVWNLLPYNTATRQLRGLYWIFYFALKEPVVCRQLWCTKQRGYPCQISSHSKCRNMKNCQGPTREPDRKATPPIKTVPWKTGLHVFWMKWVLQKAVKRSLDNSIQRRKCLQDRKFFGGKRWNIKKNSEKLSFIGKWPNYSPSTNLSTQNSIVRLCINWNFFFWLTFYQTL